MFRVLSPQHLPGGLATAEKEEDCASSLAARPENVVDVFNGCGAGHQGERFLTLLVYRTLNDLVGGRNGMLEMRPVEDFSGRDSRRRCDASI